MKLVGIVLVGWAIGSTLVLYATIISTTLYPVVCYCD